MRKGMGFLLREAREMAPPTFFFLIVLNLLVLTVAMLSDNHVISTVSFASACLGALLIGKAFLLAEHLPILEKHAKKPLLIAT
ncbi:MAG: hypothetical protein HC814_07695, partial [Rhodobacteraceae bacterium]|nr:hypothetical protein [Paracoccaceae bacterium]